MNSIKRACIYCVRHKIKTIILFCVLTIISVFILTGIAIRGASDGATTEVKMAVGGKILVELDTDGNMGDGGQNEWGTVYGYNGDLITPDIVDAISKVEGVIDYNSEDSESYYAAGVNFGYLPAAYGLSYTPYGEESSYTATISSEKCTKFQSGEYKLVEGRHITPKDKHVCIISKELADYNRVAIGDKLEMYSLDTGTITKFEILGIFDGTEGTSADALTADEIPANCGYIDYSTLFEMFGEDLNGYQQLTIYVDDPTNVQSIYDKISDLPELKGKTLKLIIDTDDYKSVSMPLDSLKKSINTIIFAIIMISAFILTLLLTIWIRTRKKEVGILLATGYKKRSIILQFLIETFAAYIVSVIVSIPISRMVSDKIGQILVCKITDGNANISVSIDLSYIVLLCLIGIGIVAISVMISSWKIIWSKPRDVITKND